jgi:hypothetical protein
MAWLLGLLLAALAPSQHDQRADDENQQQA